MKRIILILAVLGLVACNEKNPYENTTVKLTELKTFALPKVSVRAITLLSDNNVAFAGSDATFGFINTQNYTIASSNMKNLGVISDFRSVAATTQHVFMLSIGNPALLYKAEQSGMTEVYREAHPSVFYDAICFINDKEGLAIGDPIEGRMSILTTHNGGAEWQKLTWSQAPKLAEGEAVFAASNSALTHCQNKIWVVTGGAKSRVFCSENKGYKWQELATLPLAQGSPTQGAFSVAFYNDKQGIVVGGDYQQPSQVQGTAALTTDGGKTWEVIPPKNAIGYASSVKYLPNSKGYALIAISPNGIYFSNNTGEQWQRISDDGNYYSCLFVDEQTLIASGNEKITIFKINKITN